MVRAKALDVEPFVLDRPADRPVLAALFRNRWMIGTRGGVAVLFGLALVVWPPITLPAVVTLFGLYALVDGGLALAAAFRTHARLRQLWPVALEGLVSLVIGLLALLWPLRVSQELVQLLVWWAAGTGVLEILAAVHVSWKRAAHWMLLSGGVWSVFLAAILTLVPHADVARTVETIAVYALVFGTLMAIAAFTFPGDERMRRAILRGEGGRR